MSATLGRPLLVLVVIVAASAGCGGRPIRTNSHQETVEVLRTVRWQVSTECQLEASLLVDRDGDAPDTERVDARVERIIARWARAFPELSGDTISRLQAVCRDAVERGLASFMDEDDPQLARDVCQGIAEVGPKMIARLANDVGSTSRRYEDIAEAYARHSHPDASEEEKQAIAAACLDGLERGGAEAS